MQFLRARSLQNAIDEKRWIEVQRSELQWRLNMGQYVDRMIALHGFFEFATTNLVHRFIKPGMRIMDVGANMGYYTMLFAQQIGQEGLIWAFEPVTEYRDQIKWHLEHNGFTNRVCLLDFGLSNQTDELHMQIYSQGASFYRGYFPPPIRTETVYLHKLDDIVDEQLKLDRLDFVKVDVDGHECYVLEGARQTLKKFKPVMVIEFANLYLYEAGFDVIQLKSAIEDLGYILFSEKTERPFEDMRSFLLECGDYSGGANVWAIPESLHHDAPSLKLSELADQFHRGVE
jgi:FkbM family methyltransferase